MRNETIMLKCKRTNGRRADKWHKLGKDIMWYYGFVSNNTQVEIYNKENTNLNHP